MQELQSHYAEVTRQLQQSNDQLGVATRRCQTLQDRKLTRLNTSHDSISNCNFY
uniref:Paramyosin n=1 Tax=Parasteatoda tepidariorum TaxID=114398 RepID=A0A2L2Z717_PARTP